MLWWKGIPYLRAYECLQMVTEDSGLFITHPNERHSMLSANNAGKILHCQHPGWNSKLNVTFQNEWYYPKQLNFLLYLIFLFLCFFGWRVCMSSYSFICMGQYLPEWCLSHLVITHFVLSVINPSVCSIRWWLAT